MYKYYHVNVFFLVVFNAAQVCFLQLWVQCIQPPRQLWLCTPGPTDYLPATDKGLWRDYYQSTAEGTSLLHRLLDCEGQGLCVRCAEHLLRKHY